MGQDYSQLYPDEPISQATQTHLEKRFLICPHPIHSTSQHFKLLHEKLTNKKYILRVLVTDQPGKRLIEDHIFKKIANRSPHLVKLEHYIFEDVSGYCGIKTKCYLLFELDQPSTLREEILKQNTSGVFTQEQILNAMDNLMEGLLWLKYLGMPHGNINSYNVYCHPKRRNLVLSDPWMAPEGLETIYPSPQKLQKILNKLEEYDPYASDVFSIGMCMLQIVKGGKIERIYKKNHTINYDVLIEEINKCPHPQLKANLEYILLGSEDNRKEYLRQCSTKIKMKGGSSSATEKDSNRSIGIGIKRILGGKSKEGAVKLQPKSVQQPTLEINPQSFQKPMPKFEHLNGKQRDEATSKPFIDVSALQRPNEIPAATSNFTISHVKHFEPQRPPVYQAEPFGNNYAHFSNMPYNNSVKFAYNTNQPTAPVIVRELSREHLAPPPSYTPSYSPFTNIPQNTVSPFQVSSQNPSGRPSSNLPISFYPITHTQPPLPPKPSSDTFSLNYTYKPSFDHILPASSIKKTDLYYDKLYDNSQYEINKKLFNDNSFQLNAISTQKPHSFTDTHTDNKHTSSTKLIQKYEQPQPIFLQQKAATPMSIKRPTSQIQSNSSDMTEYVNKINENINTFQIGISEAISNSIQNLEVKNVIINKEPVDWKEKDKETQSRFSEFRPSENIETTEGANHKKEVVLADEKEKKRFTLEADHSDIELTESHNQGDLKESQLFFKDSLVEQIKNINEELEEASKAHYTINNPANPTTTSQQVITSLNEINEEEGEDTPETPFRMRGTQLQILNNLTIPEQAPSQEESFDGEHRQPKGQYREQEYQNGGKYMGYVQNQKRNGKGTFYYRDGGYYEGNWRDNMMNGFGKLYYDSGLLAYEGQWYRDEFHGRGKVYNDAAEPLEEPFNYRTFEDHEKYWRYYDGDLSHDMKQGHGKLMLSNDEFYMGQFRDDKPHGKGTFHSKKGMVHGVWNKGILQKEN